MSNKRKTPISEILDTSISKQGKGFKRKAQRNLDKYGIKTVEQLVTYNQTAFRNGGNTEERGEDLGIYGLFTKGQYEFLEACLKKESLSFASQPSERKTPYETIGKENVKEYLLESLASSKQEIFFSAETISRKAANTLQERTFDGIGAYWSKQDDGRRFCNAIIRGFFRKAFETTQHARPLLKELAEKGKIDMVQTEGGTFYAAKKE